MTNFLFQAEARNMLKIQKEKKKPVKQKPTQPLSKAPGKKPLTQGMKGGKNKRIPLRVTLRAEAASGNVKEEEKMKTLDIILKGKAAFISLLRDDF